MQRVLTNAAAFGLALVLVVGAMRLSTRATAGTQSGFLPLRTPAAGQEEATFSGGCFWAMQAMFSQLRGVDSVEPGYAGGSAVRPTYEDVCTETTGHAETIDVIFDPKIISYDRLMTVFFAVHDPTTPDRQGDDEGSSYRSMVFYHNDSQRNAATSAVAKWEQAHPGQHVVTQIVPFTVFYPAETYHNNYFVHHQDEPYCAFTVAPKVEKFRDHFGAWLK